MTSATILGVEAVDLEAPVLFDTHLDLLTTVRGALYLSASGAVTVDLDFLGPDGSSVGPGRRLMFDRSVGQAGEVSGTSGLASQTNIGQLQYALSIADQFDINRGLVLPFAGQQVCVCEGRTNNQQSCQKWRCEEDYACEGGGGDCMWQEKRTGQALGGLLAICGLFVALMRISGR